ncbi:MAG: ribosome maturation factor RimM [Methylovirgula sp.]
MPKSRQSEPPPAEKRVLVGRIGATHGVSGAVRLLSFTEGPQAIGTYGVLTDAQGARFEIVALRPLKDDLVIAHFAGIATREAAEALNGTELYVARTSLPAAAEEEFYHADLIGLAAHNPAGEHIGRVVNMLNFGGGDILEIEPRDRGETLLVPFTKEAVPSIDVKAGRIVILSPVEIEAETSLESDLAPRSAPRASSR